MRSAGFSEVSGCILVPVEVRSEGLCAVFCVSGSILFRQVNEGLLLTQRVAGYGEKTEQKRELSRDLHVEVGMGLQTCCEEVQVVVGKAERLNVKLDRC